MIAWWWLVIAVALGAFLGMALFAWAHKGAIQEMIEMRLENERLHRRIQLIGERRLDGTIHDSQGER